MTYTVIGRCERTGRLGIGIATYSINVGRYCTGLRARIGVTITQAFPNEGNNDLALGLLAQGFRPTYVLKALEQNDPYYEYRQIAIVDRDGAPAAHTGAKTRPWSGHETGNGYVAFGNVLAGENVVTAIAEGFRRNPGAELEERLIAGLEAGRNAGGQRGSQGHLTERSAALVVYGDFDYCDTDLRVDLHDTAVDELRRIYEEYKPYQAYYRERSRNPRAAISQDEFVADLARQAVSRS
jgi:uncharacterized Ntn-hydrolase superfamily protein